MIVDRRNALALLGSVAALPLLGGRAKAAASLYRIGNEVKCIAGFLAPRPDGRFISTPDDRLISTQGLQAAFFTPAGGGEVRRTIQFAGTASAVSRAIYVTNDRLLMATTGTLAASPAIKGVFALPLDAIGRAVAAPIRISTSASEEVSRVALSMISPDTAVAAWRTGAASDDFANVRYRILSASGTPKSGVLTVKRPSGRLGYTLLGVQGFGNGLAAIAFYRHDVSRLKGPVFIQVIDSTGAPVGPHIRLGATVGSGSFSPGVTVNWLDMCDAGNGLLATAWVIPPDMPYQGQTVTLAARKVSANGELGRVRTLDTGLNFTGDPQIIMDPGGKFIATVGGIVAPEDEYLTIYVRGFVLGDGLRHESTSDVFSRYDREDTYSASPSSDLVRLTNSTYVAAFSILGIRGGGPRFQRFGFDDPTA